MELASISPTAEPIPLVLILVLTGFEFERFKRCTHQIDLHSPAGIIERLYGESALVLPVTIALS
jgi:hypothetical protein